MAFKMTAEYREYQIRGLERAIRITRENLAKQTDHRAIEGHEAQIRSHERDLAKIRAKLEAGK